MKLVHLVGFITKKFVTMHGHMDVKSFVIFYYTVKISGLFFPISSRQNKFVKLVRLVGFNTKKKLFPLQIKRGRVESL